MSDGYAVVEAAVDPATASVVLAGAFACAAAQLDSGLEAPPPPGCDTVWRLAGKVPEAAALMASEAVLAAVRSFLGEQVWGGNPNYRSGWPGLGLAPLAAVPAGECVVVWSLGPFEPLAGAPRVVPGSHRGPPPGATDPATLRPHPDEVVPEVPPGGALVVGPGTWWGERANLTQAMRPTAFATYRAGPAPPAPIPLDPAYADLPAAVLALLGPEAAPLAKAGDPCWCGRRDLA